MHSSAKPVPNDYAGTELVRDWSTPGQAHATVVLAHGIGEHSGRYERTGDLMSEAGLQVRSYDWIGAGGSGGDRWDIDTWSRFHDQLESHVVWALEQGRPVVLVGHSLGGLLAIGYLLRDRPKPVCAVLSAPALRGGAAWQRAVAPLGARLAPRVALPTKVRGEQLSRDPAVGEAYFADPLVHTKATNRLGLAVFQEMDEVAALLGPAPVPTLVLHGGLDTLVPTQYSAVLGDLPGYERRLYPTLRHEIFNEPEGPEVVAEMIDWIKSHI